MPLMVLGCVERGGPSVGNGAPHEPLCSGAGALAAWERYGLFSYFQRVRDALLDRTFSPSGARCGCVLRIQAGALHFVAQDLAVVLPRGGREPGSGPGPFFGDRGGWSAEVVRPGAGERAAGGAREAGGDPLALLRGSPRRSGIGAAGAPTTGRGAALPAGGRRAGFRYLGCDRR